jgi:hypothetical protein
VKPINVRNHLWRVVGATIVLAAGLGANGTVEFTVAATEPTGRWKNVHYFSGRLGGERVNASCDFNHRLRTDVEGFDLWVERDRIAFTLPPITYQSCPADRSEITITRIAFSRGLRRVGPTPYGGDLVSATITAAMDIFRAKAITRYFLSLDYREPGGDEASATFYFEGQEPAALLTSLSRISKVPVDVTDSEAAILGRSVNVSVSFDPHRRLLANVPIWESRALALEGSISQIAPDGSVALANHALWELQTGKLRHRLARPSKRYTVRELLAAEGRWLLWAGNSGPLNGKNAMRAGEVTITDTTAAATVAHVGPLPYVFDILLAPDATLALAFVQNPHPQQGRLGSTVSAIAIDRGAVIWQAPVPASAARIGRSDPARVLAFGLDWIRLWNGATGESLFDSIAILTEVAHERIAILDAASVKDRIIVVYATKAGKQIASIDLNSGRILNQTQLSASSAPGSHTWWSPARNVVFVASEDRLSLWDTETLRLVGDLNPQPGRGRFFAEFDASGQLLATMRYTSEGLDRHVVITDVHTRTPVGQCLLGDAEAMQLASDGRTVLGYQGNSLLFCKRAD